MRALSKFCRVCTALTILLVMQSSGFAARSFAQSTTAPQYTPEHELLAPKGYETWVFVGSNLGLKYRRDLTGMTVAEAARREQEVFHNIYINPEAFTHFRETGKFPEPTILVMERFAAVDKEPNGVLAKGVYNGARVGLEVAVKNSARPDGSKTLWAYYDFTDHNDPTKILASARAFEDEVCETCHRKHASHDNVWVQLYPSLRMSK